MTPEQILFCPGPVMVSARVRQALLHPDMCHRVPSFESIIENLQTQLLKIYGADDNYVVLLITGSGTAANETVISSYFTARDKVLLVHNGEVVDEVTLDGDRTSLDYTKTLEVSGSGWYHLRAEGSPDERFPLDTSYAQAFSNPVWVTVGDQPIRSRESAEYSIRWIDKLREMAEAWPGWRSQEERDHVYAQFDEAKAIYQRFASEAR